MVVQSPAPTAPRPPAALDVGDSARSGLCAGPPPPPPPYGAFAFGPGPGPHAASASVSPEAGRSASPSATPTPPSSPSQGPAAAPTPPPPVASAPGGGGERYMWVLDPMTRKLRVPISAMVPTQATSTPGTVPSLCMLFLEGRCRHPWCRQAHVPADVLNRLRADSLRTPNCCGRHGDPHDATALLSRFHSVLILGLKGGPPSPTPSPASPHALSPASGPTSPGASGAPAALLAPLSPTPSPPQGDDRAGSAPAGVSPVVSPATGPVATTNGSGGGGSANTAGGLLVSADRLAMTVGLHRFLAQSVPPGPSSTGVLEVGAKHICRLHAARRCRYMDDCNNFHFCRELDLPLPQAAPSSAPSSAPATLFQAICPQTTTCVVGAVHYAVTPLAHGAVSDTDLHQMLLAHKQSYPHVPIRIVDVRAACAA